MAKLNEILIEHIDKVREISFKKHPVAEFETFQLYYEGDQSNLGKAKSSKYLNIIKMIVETKTTFILDNHITTSIIPNIFRTSDISTANQKQRIADILEDAKERVFKTNKMNRIKEGVVKNGNITNIGAAKITWDDSMADGLGDIKITEIMAKNLFMDPSASDIQDGSYVFEEISYSPYALKRKYPDKAKEIDRLIGVKGTSIANKLKNTVADATGVITAKSGTNTKQMFAYDTTGVQDMGKDIPVIEAYLKDDSTYDDMEGEGAEEEKVARMGKAKYPNGRFVVYAGTDVIFEDSEMETPFFPYALYYETNGNKIYSPGGVVRDLTFIQDRINRAGERLRYLMGKFVSMIVADSASGVNEKDFINKDVLILDAEALARGLAPKVLTNNTISEIKEVQIYIDKLKTDAKEQSRINDMMLSGEKPKGVTSGEMVDALNESPMTSIRQSQRNFMDFNIDLTDKVVFFVQKFYSQERIIESTTGKRYVKLPLRTGDDNQGPIEIITPQLDDKGKPKTDENGEIMEDVETIKADIGDGQFHTDIIAGSEMPRTKTQTAQITMTLADKGFFGDPESMKTKERVLTAIDYPNRRAIIDDMRDEQIEAQDAAPPAPDPLAFMKGMNVSFKDLEGYPGAQAKLLVLLGLLEKPPEVAAQESQEQEPGPMEALEGLAPQQGPEAIQFPPAAAA